ncbi:glycosyltransferase family 2 protein [Candidatus Poriferisodalis sp.]|uniref:glycosyltransferase family 2 protein n=1 Tax=Candidatus Poriferisodalis sp. TaxID=3101277 RepID=UPI003B01E31E
MSDAGAAGGLRVTAGGPHVTVVIPARNCAAELPGCLDAVSAQTYRGSLDVIVAVAPSSDETEDVARESNCAWPLEVVDNPAGTTSSGLNLAIAEAAGSVIVRVDAQARLPADYVERAVATLAKSGAANVGGVQSAVGRSGLSRVIAAAVSSPFGGGPAAFRQGSHSGPVDTVYLGVFDAAALRSVGGFDESLERNQDYELNWRLHEAGHVVWLDPSLVVEYLPRSSWAGLARQYFDYGVWKRVVISRHPRSMQPRQLAAPALVVGLVLSACQLAKGRQRGLIAPAAYIGACALAAARLRSSLPQLGDRVRAAAAFAVMHFSWGAGFLLGPRRGNRHGARAPAMQGSADRM